MSNLKKRLHSLSVTSSLHASPLQLSKPTGSEIHPFGALRPSPKPIITTNLVLGV